MQMLLTFTKEFLNVDSNFAYGQVDLFTQRASPVFLKCLLTFSDVRSHGRIYLRLLNQLLQHHCDCLDLSDWQNVVIFKCGPISRGNISYLILQSNGYWIFFKYFYGCDFFEVKNIAQMVIYRLVTKFSVIWIRKLL